MSTPTPAMQRCPFCGHATAPRLSGGFAPTEAAAIERWNRRASLPAVQGEQPLTPWEMLRQLDAMSGGVFTRDGKSTIDSLDETPAILSELSKVQGERQQLPESMQPNVDAFIAALPDLLTHSEGRYVVVHRGMLQPAADTYEAALRLGYETFGLDPFIVQRVERPGSGSCADRRSGTAACTSSSSAASLPASPAARGEPHDPA